jgi:hydroxyquinol 1,2-dioxygenase
MRNLNESDLTEAVLAKLVGTRDPRLAQILTSLVRHLHAFVRETELTEAEWLASIAFLTATGHKCDGKRQEFILLSDTLGISMLVDAIANRRPTGATESTVLGPFYVPGAPELPMWADIGAPVSAAPVSAPGSSPGAPATPAFVEGRVLDLDGRPIPGATLDVWQVDDDGLYDVQRGAASTVPGTVPTLAPTVAASCGRGRFTTDAAGRYGFRTTRPVSYSIPTDGPVGQFLRATGRSPDRPAHVHMIVAAPGFAPVTTHLFVAGDPHLDSDAVFAVKQSLIVNFVAEDAGPAPDGRDCPVPFFHACYDFHLVRASPPAVRP